MKAKDLLQQLPCEFFAGVPDSQLKALCDYLYLQYGTGASHCIAHNEGGAVALASGYYLATGKVPCVYLQNSGIGNLVNPVCSLTSPDVYGIPIIFIVGWRGEPGVPDEPQHIYQGKITLSLLEELNIASFVLDPDTTPAQVRDVMDTQFLPLLQSGKSVAFVVRKGALEASETAAYRNPFSMTRESVIERLSREAGVFISTTGKASRELFEIRTARHEGHERDFLTVGSMGHCSMIALGVAASVPNVRVWCLEGDGSALMHLGAEAVIGARQQKNLVHVLLNNRAHDSVGGMPTVSGSVDFVRLAGALGYPRAFHVSTEAELEQALTDIRKTWELTLLAADVQIGSRSDLGRPTTAPDANKAAFMRYITKGDSQ